MTEDEMVDGITDLMDMSLNKLWEMVKDREARSAAVHGVTKIQTWLSNWAEMKSVPIEWSKDMVSMAQLLISHPGQPFTNMSFSTKVVRHFEITF